MGDKALDVKPIANDLQEVNLLNPSVHFQVISTLPTLVGQVCLLQAKRFNEQASKLASVSFRVVSMDLPFTQGKFAVLKALRI